MLNHYTRMALKALMRFKLHTFISLTSLVFGFFCFIAASLLGQYFNSYDQHFPNADKTYSIIQRITDPSVVAGVDTSVLINEPTARYLRSAFPEMPYIVRGTMPTATDITVADQTESYRVRFIDSDFLKVFPIPIAQGLPENTPLPPYSALISEEAATLSFGSSDVVGRIVTVNNEFDVTIVGVIGEFENPSHLGSAINVYETDMIISSDVFDRIQAARAVAFYADPNADRWGSQNNYVFIQFPADAEVDIAEFNARLYDFTQTYVPDNWSDVMTYELQPVNKLMLSQIAVFAGGLDVSTVLIMMGALVLLIGCLNYSNLVIAQLSLRSQEIAVQKILGAKRGLLILQYCYESFLFVLLALGISVVSFWFILNRMDSAGVIGVSPAMLLNPGLWLILSLVIIAIVLIAGFYPAVRTALVRLVTMMRPKGSGGYSGKLRSLMVGLQFFISGTLMILAIVMFNQNTAMTQQLDGEVADPKIAISIPLSTLDIEPDLLSNRLQTNPGVLSVTQSRQLPWDLGLSAFGLSLSPDPNSETVGIASHIVGYDFPQTMDIEQIAGRGFSRERNNDLYPSLDELRENAGPFSIVIDQEAVQSLGFANPGDALGQSVYRHYGPPQVTDSMSVEMTIVGVLGPQKFQFIDYNNFGLAGESYILQPDNADYMIIRAARENLNETLLHIDSTWNELLPDTVLRRTFADDLFFETYQLFMAMSLAITLLSIFGFLIASIGLMGNATFITNIRQREVGIRKVLGASSKRLMAMLLFDFAKPVLIANAIAWPLGFLLARVYVSFFAVQTGLNLMPFLISLFLSVFIAVLAVLSQSWKSARVRPALTLRYE